MKLNNKLARSYQFVVFSLKPFEFCDNFFPIFDQRVQLFARLLHEHGVLQADVLKIVNQIMNLKLYSKQFSKNMEHILIPLENQTL